MTLRVLTYCVYFDLKPTSGYTLFPPPSLVLTNVFARPVTSDSNAVAQYKTLKPVLSKAAHQRPTFKYAFFPKD